MDAHARPVSRCVRTQEGRAQGLLPLPDLVLTNRVQSPVAGCRGTSASNR